MEDMLGRGARSDSHVRWVMGVARVVDPILSRLRERSITLGLDEQCYLCYVDANTLRPHGIEGIRQAEACDAGAVASLRSAFEREYFGMPASQVSRSWCLRLARRYIERGTFIAEQHGQVISMAATEAETPDLAQIGAVYTRRGYRTRGLARAVVSALSADHLDAKRAQPKRRAMLTVRRDNTPALRAYASIGFAHWEDYRMTKLK